MEKIVNTRVRQLELIQDEAKELFRKKNIDYGDAFADYGTVGVLVRMGDKIRRFQSITNKGINLVEDEKLRDTLIDLHNYAAMGIMLIDEKNFNEEYNFVEKVKDLSIEEQEKENEVKIWKVEGSIGHWYERKSFINSQGEREETCTCPSFNYCSYKYKTCKHIYDSELFKQSTNK